MEYGIHLLKEEFKATKHLNLNSIINKIDEIMQTSMKWAHGDSSKEIHIEEKCIQRILNAVNITHTK